MYDDPTLHIKFHYGYVKNFPLITECKVYWKDKILEGYAFCNKNFDNPQKKIGRKIAFSRAIKNLPREHRKFLWEQYKKHFSV
ncbi:MAG: hypothetical protein KatS3mg002_1007 [Candidatus Woesearchaeota archaeon]|nr:MAG: hypothetical protein KatS3mg002_1007 [Candidatus Woesearchaeota archaeon]